MAIKYNIDAVLENEQPVVVFRGREYKVRDLTVKETIRNIKDAQKKEELVNKRRKERVTQEVVDDGFPEEEVEEEVKRRLEEMSMEESFVDYIPLAVEVLTEALEGFPTDIGDNITFKEFRALQSALNAANSQSYTVKGEKDTEKKS